MHRRPFYERGVSYPSNLDGLEDPSAFRGGLYQSRAGVSTQPRPAGPEEVMIAGYRDPSHRRQ
ncbi:hypothetical protein I552_4474 [Mycobacterium xenopi 3993]|nr:hypothetical protein I552_4474 [Mycobacterium xenopi 3993]